MGARGLLEMLALPAPAWKEYDGPQKPPTWTAPSPFNTERDGGDKNGSWILPSGPLVFRLPMLAENIPSKAHLLLGF